jgi:subtilisin family serine protease
MSSIGGFEFIKPDVVAPGGGRETQEKDDEEGELLHQTSTGWAEGMHDGLKDARGMMKGTSMATPHVAGFVDLLYNAGIVSTAREVKRVMRDRGTVREYASAAENANVAVNSKNVAVGFDPISESVFTPES